MDVTLRTGWCLLADSKVGSWSKFEIGQHGRWRRMPTSDRRPRSRGWWNIAWSFGHEEACVGMLVAHWSDCVLGLLVLCVCPNTTDDVASIIGAVEAATQPYHLAYFLTHMERQDHGERKKGGLVARDGREWQQMSLWLSLSCWWTSNISRLFHIDSIVAWCRCSLHLLVAIEAGVDVALRKCRTDTGQRLIELTVTHQKASKIGSFICDGGSSLTLNTTTIDRIRWGWR